MKLIISLILITLIQTSCSRQNEKLDKIKQLSKEIVFLDMHEFVYNRTAQVRFRKPNGPLVSFLEFSDSLTIGEIEQCLKNEDAKIRALGLLSLYQTDNHIHLLRIADFLTDSTRSYKASPFYRFHQSGIKGPSAEELLANAKYLSVADIAASLMGHYFRQSGYVYFDKDLEKFLNERKGLEYTAGFLKLLNLKATGGISPLKEERQPLVEDLRKRINAIPSDIERTIYKIYLSTNEYGLFSQNEILTALKLLGEENIRKVLMRQPPVEDPDLLNIKNREISNFDYNRMCKWILLNGNEIFGTEDIRFLLERAKYERENTRPWNTTLSFTYWHIAAARLDKENSSEYIKSCLKDFEGEFKDYERIELYTELWHQKGLEEIDLILDWIFNSYVLNEQGQERIDVFINSLNQKEDLTLLKRIIADKRFDHSINVKVVTEIARQINRLEGETLINDQLIEGIDHPTRLGQVEWRFDEAMKKYPKETKKMLDDTKVLKEKLRKIKWI